MTRYLITGAYGQDGSYLAEALTHVRRDGTIPDHEVWCLEHHHGDSRRGWLEAIAPGVRFIEGDLTDQLSLTRALTMNPDVIFHLGAESAPAAGWMTAEKMADVTALGTLRLLSAVHLLYGSDPATAPTVVTAGSIATHGIYGAAKSFSRAVAADYRERGLAVSTAVFGGHHSPRRPAHFFSRKVTLGAATIAWQIETQLIQPQRLKLGPLDRLQDWGAAPEFVEALLEIADGPPGDYVVSTGEPHTSREWVQAAFRAVDLDWEEWVEFDASLGQPTDVQMLHAEPSSRLLWRPGMSMADLTEWMVHADLNRLRAQE